MKHQNRWTTRITSTTTDTGKKLRKHPRGKWMISEHYFCKTKWICQWPWCLNFFSKFLCKTILNIFLHAVRGVVIDNYNLCQQLIMYRYKYMINRDSKKLVEHIVWIDSEQINIQLNYGQIIWCTYCSSSLCWQKH